MEVEYFKASKTTKRWNVNQKVWVRYRFANHLYVWFKFRGSGRYVSGVVGRFSSAVGEIKSIEVSDSFGKRIIPYDAIS